MLVFASALALSGCVADPAPAPVPAASSTPETAPVADPIRRVFGQWHVETVGGAKPDWTRMVLVVGEDWMHWQSQCVSGSADFKIDDGTLDFAPITRRFPAVKDREGPLYAMCARGLSDAERAVTTVLEGNPEWRVENGGKLVIASPAGPLIARRLEETVANPMEYTSFDPAVTFGSWRVAALDGEPVADAQLVLAGRLRTLRTGCAYYQWFAWSDMTGDHELARREPFRTGCERAETESERKLAAALGEVTSYAADGLDARLLSGSMGTVRLER